jgi:TolB-like protein
LSFFEELKRRNVFRVGIAYGITAWLIAQITELFLETFGAPAWVMKSVLMLLLLGMPLSVFLAWVYELTPEGIRRESENSHAEAARQPTGKRMDRAIIVVLALAVVFLLYRQSTDQDVSIIESVQEPGADLQIENAKAGSVTMPLGKSIAVLPFVAMSTGEDDGYFADGLTEEILNSLAQLPGLMVTARTSSFHFKGQDLPVQQIASQLGVAHIVEGSVRRSGEQIRVTAQLVRAADGFHLWSDTFDGIGKDGFDMQTRIAEKVAQALDVVLDDHLRERMRMFGLRNPEAFIAFQKGMDLFTSAHGIGNADQLSLLREANVYFEQVIDLVPNFMGAYQRHSDLYTHIALEMAVGKHENGIDGIDIEATRRATEADFEAAFMKAPDMQTKSEAELDRAIISGNWRGLSTLIDRGLSTRNCSNPMWGHIVSSSFGKVDVQYQDALRDTQCDPLRPGGHVDLIHSAIWQGDFPKAVEISAASLQTTSGDWLASTHVQALLANGALDEAELAIQELIRSQVWIFFAQTNLAAARGDAALLEKLENQGGQTGEVGDDTRLMFAALRGNRKAANLQAAKIDARPFGPMKLAQLVYICLCGAPFDIEATPNFATSLEDAGLLWPPPDTITFPLKDW